MLLRKGNARSSDDRAAAIEEITAIGYKHKSLRLLARIACRAGATDASKEVREAAADGLGLVGTQADYRCLCTLLKDENWFVRCSAAQSLGTYPAKHVLSKLVDLVYNDPDDCVRKWSIFGLLKLESPDLTEPIFEQILASDRVPDFAKEPILRERLMDGGEPFLNDYLQLLVSDDCLAGDEVLRMIHQETEFFSSFSPNSKEKIIAALELRIQHLETFGWKNRSVQSSVSWIATTIERIKNLDPPTL
ncbi:MAG: HEAT repeat domain-containing protein [Armatimonadetes bacterium]|nr:HEAT repeat domain-containing protein [Armatimonadota bacterium]